MKKSLFAIMTMLLLALCACAGAEEPEQITSGDYVYTLLEDGTAEIVRYSGREAKLTIPEVLDGVRVTSIGDAAFYECSRLTGVTIPDRVTSIGANPFRYCEKLFDVYVSPEHPALATIDGVLFSKADKRLVWYPMTKTDQTYTIPQGIAVIGDYAFYYCRNLTGVTIPDSVTSIGDSAFGDCSRLTGVTIPDSVTNIGVNPFRDCEKLSDVYVSPDHSALATIDGVLFSKADKRLVWYPMTKIDETYTIPQGIALIGDFAFYGCHSLTGVTIPDGATSIGDSAFEWCSCLTGVTIPDSVTSIGDFAFRSCSSLMGVTIPSSVTSIGDRTFYKCSSLTGVTIPSSVTSIGDSAFSCCDCLTSVTIPNGVTSIGNLAFYNCSSLKSVTIPDSVTSIGKKAFAVYENGAYVPNPALTLTVPRNSYAAQYCRDNGLKYQYPDSLDWLLN